MSLLLFLTIVPFYFLSAIQGVASHGFVASVSIDGQENPGWNPFNDPYQNPVPERVIRKIQSDGPVPETDDLACGIGGDVGTSVVKDIAAGSQISFEWGNWPADHQGPVSTYMASCDGDCTNFSASKAKWFKVDAGGYNPSTSLWAADELRANDNTWTSTIPAQLKPGQYLVRNEIIALHSQTPQYYPACAQVRVTGSGTEVPSNLVSMQDVYRGAKWPFIYGDFGSFTIPGPAPAFDGNTETPSSPRPSPTASTSASSETGSGIPEGQQTSPTSTATRAPAATTTASGHCRLQSRRLHRKRLAKNDY